MANDYKKGEWSVTCDVDGFDYYSSELIKRWDGVMVSKASWEPRHPQDFVRSVPDKQSVPWTRAEPEGIDVSPTYAVDTLTPVPPGTFNNGT